MALEAIVFVLRSGIPWEMLPRKHASRDARRALPLSACMPVRGLKHSGAESTCRTGARAPPDLEGREHARRSHFALMKNRRSDHQSK
ncbi:hypothetical protein D7W82_02610 [Corallococcus sp. CA049B]|nr:hypothetical protein D7W82_02610 [Corallococcus sp. CA049B]